MSGQRIQVLAVAVLASTASALRLQPVHAQQSRRELLINSASALTALAAAAPAHAAVSELADPNLSKEERTRLALARKETERVANLPINKLKGMRAQLGSAPALVESDQWDELRDLIRDTTGGPLTELQKKNQWSDQSTAKATVAMRKLLFDVETVAYSQQKFPGSNAVGGYCAPGVVPRDSNSGCKVRPSLEKVPIVAKLNEAMAKFDELIALRE